MVPCLLDTEPSLFLLVPVAAVLFFTVLAAVNLLFGVGKDKYMVEPLLDRSDAAGIFTFNDIHDLFRELQLPFFYNLLILDDIYGDVVIDKADDVEIQRIHRAFDFYNILLAHLVAAGIFNDGYLIIHLVEAEVMIDRHGFSGFDMVKNIPFVKSTYI